MTASAAVRNSIWQFILSGRVAQFILVTALFVDVLAAGEAPPSVADLNAAAIKAYQAKNYAEFLANEQRALALDPDNARLGYNVACGEALTGNAKEAVRHLDELVDRKLDLGAEGDDDFAGIRKTPEWSQFTAKLEELRKPMVRSERAFTIADPELVAVGLAIDESNGDVYLASVRERKIVRRTKAGVVSDFVREGQEGFLAGASLLIDPSRRLLFASTSAVPFMRGYRKEDEGRSGVFAFDLRTGKVVRKAFLAVDGKPHFLNALALDRSGALYVSDSAVGGIYRLGRDSGALEILVAPGVFRSTQGLAFSEDEKTLYVADFSDGVWAFDMAAKTRTLLPMPKGSWLAGLDGLSRVAEGFIAVQIGVKPERVLRLRLDSNRRRIAAVDTLESNHPDYNGPIQGIVAGSSYLYIANSQLALANAQTGGFAAENGKPTVILRLPMR
jgi:sugar lactone lactonase YvrE